MDACAWERKAKEAATPLTFDSMLAWALFCEASSQWRAGFAGATGLDYAGVETWARWQGLRITPRAGDLIRALERERLELWAQDAKAREKK
jgi:hypothetical protein